jgi:outer membrane lipoprotein-sorting protein
MRRTWQLARSTAVIVSACLVILTHAAAADTPNADTIMQQVEDRPQGKDRVANLKLTIRAKKGGTSRIRSMTSARKNTKDVSKVVLFFSAPKDMRNVAFLVWDNKSGDDQRWIYLPTSGQVRKLVTSDSRASFFGSDFTYEDLTNRDPGQDTHELVGSQKVDKWDCWLVESTPKNAKGLDFAKYRSWVWKTGNMIVRQELLDSSGKVVKRLQANSIANVQTIPTYTSITVSNLETGSESKLETSENKYDTGLADERFGEDQLKRGAPAK